jgi:NitT/TauT family transport system ATP-binding protein
VAYITFDRVTKTYRSGSRDVTAVEDLSFTVERGERVAIVGETGCGKSTTITLLLGLAAATRGRVEVEGMDVYAHFDRLRGRVAAVFQTDRLLPWKTTIANVRLPIEILGRREADLAVTPAQWIARLGLAGFEDAYPYELSGGMRQRVAIARALVSEPDLILCDEAFGHLDEVTATALRREFLALTTGSGRTLLFITHSIEEAFVLGQRVLVMRRPGQVAAEVAVPGDASPAALADLRARVLETMASVKQAAMPWQAGDAPNGGPARR